MKILWVISLVVLGLLQNAQAQQDPAPNDKQEDAIEIETGTSLRGTLLNATVEENEDTIIDLYDQSVWYRWKADSPGNTRIRSTSSHEQTRLQVFRESEGGGLKKIAGSAFYRNVEPPGETGWTSAGSSEARFISEPNEDYLIQVLGRSSIPFPDFILEVVPIQTSSPGTLFEPSRIPESRGLSFSIPVEGILLQEGEPNTGHHGSVWRKWKPRGSGFWTLSVSHGNLDVWRGESLAELTSASVAKVPFSERVKVIKANFDEILWVRLSTSGIAPLQLNIQQTNRGDMFDDPRDLGRVTEIRVQNPRQEILTVESAEESSNKGNRWYLWEAPLTGTYQISNWQAGVAVFKGDSIDSLISAPGYSVGFYSQTQRRIEAKAGEKFRLRVHYDSQRGNSPNVHDGFTRPSFSTLRSNYLFDLYFLGNSPPHDLFENAVQLESRTNINHENHNRGATLEVGERTPERDLQNDDSVWHRWIAPENGHYHFEFSSEKDLQYDLLKGSELENLKALATASTRSGNGIARLRFQADAGETFHIRISGTSNGQQGNYQFSLEPVIPPVNDDFENAIPFETVPTTLSGTTHFAKDFVPREVSVTSSRDQKSRIWWKWTARDNNFYEVVAGAEIGLWLGDEFVELIGPRLKFEATGKLRFKAMTGQDYYITTTQLWENAGEIEVTLKKIPSLSHTTPERAVGLGESDRFTTNLLEAERGSVYVNDRTEDSGIWWSWTPNKSGWVQIHSSGSQAAPIISVYPEADLENALATSDRSSRIEERDFGKLATWETQYVGYPDDRTGRRGFLRQIILRDPELVPEVSRVMLEVTAGEKYLIFAKSDRLISANENLSVGLKLNGEFVNAPPSLLDNDTAPRWQNSEDGGFLTGTFTIRTPNGFHSGQVSFYPGKVGFDRRNRISGDDLQGVYQVVIPHRSRDQEIEINHPLLVRDQLGGIKRFATGTITLPPTAEEFVPGDRLGPRIEGITGGPRTITFNDEDVQLDLEIAISDLGGSGFQSGFLLLPGTNDDHGARDWPRIPISSENRVGGDSQIGIYQVTFTIPAETPAGQMIYHLRDHAGNLTGQAVPHPDFVNQYDPFVPGLLFPVTLERRNLPPEDTAPAKVTFGETIVSETRLISRATLEHDVGIGGGEVLLLDHLGGVVAAKALQRSDRISGTPRSSQYDVVLSLPTTPSTGPHWLVWIVVSSDGRRVVARHADPLMFPGGEEDDTHLPTLQSFEVQVGELDLLRKPGEVTINLSAMDDQPGLQAEIRISDSESRFLASRTLNTETTSLNEQFTITLPVVERPSRSPQATLTIILTDGAGGTNQYGRAGFSPWPADSETELKLWQDQLNRLEVWRTSWPGLREDSSDSDGDGWSDLLEFALGTDPGRAGSFDPLAGRLPQGITRTIRTGNGPQNRFGWSYSPAPWISAPDSEWELLTEHSHDLVNWQKTPSRFLTLLPRFRSITDGSRPFEDTPNVPFLEDRTWLRLKVRPSNR